MKKQLISEILKIWKNNYSNKSSKWYKSDLEDFTRALSGKSEKDLKTQLNNLKCLSGLNSTFNKTIEAEEKKMLKAGMYDLKNMKNKNALD